jgi:hypothetical protein
MSGRLGRRKFNEGQSSQEVFRLLEGCIQALSNMSRALAIVLFAVSVLTISTKLDSLQIYEAFALEQSHHQKQEPLQTMGLEPVQSADPSLRTQNLLPKEDIDSQNNSDGGSKETTKKLGLQPNRYQPSSNPYQRLPFPSTHSSPAQSDLPPIFAIPSNIPPTFAAPSLPVTPPTYTPSRFSLENNYYYPSTSPSSSALASNIDTHAPFPSNTQLYFPSPSTSTSTNWLPPPPPPLSPPTNLAELLKNPYFMTEPSEEELEKYKLLSPSFPSLPASDCEGIFEFTIEGTANLNTKKLKSGEHKVTLKLTADGSNSVNGELWFDKKSSSEGGNEFNVEETYNNCRVITGASLEPILKDSSGTSSTSSFDSNSKSSDSDDQFPREEREEGDKKENKREDSKKKSSDLAALS